MRVSEFSGAEQPSRRFWHNLFARRHPVRLPTKTPLAEIGHARKGRSRGKLEFSTPGLLLLAVGLTTWWPVQAPTSEPARASQSATVIFSLDFPDSDPERYSISVSADGHARYECSAKLAPNSEERESYQSDFEFSAANRVRIFELAAQAHYFAGKIDSGNRKLAFTGNKKLIYKDGEHSYSAEYNYSSLPAVQQLTALFQNVAATMEYGRRIGYYHRYQKLALDEELKRMEAQARGNELNELQALEPVLQEIFADTSVINVVRARAQRLVEMGKSRAGTEH